MVRASRNWLVVLLVAFGLFAVGGMLLAGPVKREMAIRDLRAQRGAGGGSRGDVMPLVAPFDMTSRRALVAVNDLPFAGCPTPPVSEHDSESVQRFYTDDKQSVRDPKKWAEGGKLVRPLRIFGNTLAQMTSDDLMDRAPDSARRTCMIQYLESWSKAGAQTGTMTYMTSSNRAWFVIINAATALIALKQDGAITPEQAAPIEHWLTTMAWSVFDLDDHMMRRIKGTPRYPNNHVYWAGAAAVTAAVAAQDPALFARGVEAGRQGLMQVDRDGLLSGELWRGQRSYAYTLWGAGPLLLIVRYAKANGIDLTAINDHALMRFSHAIVRAHQAPGLFEARAGAEQLAIREWPQNAGDLQFADLLLGLGPDPEIEQEVAPYRPIYSQMLGGDMTALYAPPAIARNASLHPSAKPLLQPPL